MRKTLRALLLILVIAAPTYAGDIPFGVAPPPPPDTKTGAMSATTETESDLFTALLRLLLPGI